MRTLLFSKSLKTPHPREVYEKRMHGKKHLILTAFHGKKMVGFKVGYDKFEDGKNFYLGWEAYFRSIEKRGVADALAQQQEIWANAQGFESVILKTRNCHRGMLIFAIKNDFKIIDIELREDISQHRILLKKML